jgi:gamma-glutamyltranspeptidase/glutathione hydrolase
LTLAKTVIADHAAVASEQPLATLAGYDVLRDGGNAFDAAVATSFALAVTFHPAGGLGGDFFGMFYEAKSGKVHCLNASGWSPSGLSLELVNAKAGGSIPQFGPLSCVVPGFVAGVWEMHRKLGSVDFKGLLERAVELASNGFPAGEGICRSVAGAYPELTPEAKAIFAPSGKPTSPGEWIRQPALAKVVAEVGAEGPDSFYKGSPAEKIRDALEAQGVPCKEGDFSDFRSEWVEPLELDYRGTTVYEVPPNSMGATTLLILRLISEHDFSKAGPLSKDRITTTMKAVLFAYARRDEVLGDPRFGPVDLNGFLSAHTSSAPPPRRIRSGDTTAFSVADREGNLVSGIQSLFNHFGSRLFIPECGIALNNRASGFSVSGPNKVEPRKRPLHTLSSMILERGGRPYLAIGASGGDYRPLQHALFVTNSVDFGMTAEQNVAHPRFLWGGGRKVLVEAGYELPSDGEYDFQNLPMPGRTGVCQAVEIAGSNRKAVCDVRGDGIPAGF